MSKSSILKIGAALVLLAVVLIFLGVNYVPRISAGTPTNQTSSASFYTNSEFLNRHPYVITELDKNVGSDWVERHGSNYYAGSDWIERQR